MKNQFEILLERWQNEKTITKKAAAKMQSEWSAYSAEKASNRWTIAISFIGAILLGIAALSYISINWQELGRGEKLFLAFFATFSAFGSGYFLSEIKETYTKTGKALLFLSCILFGATLMLISQIYHLSGDPWKLLAVWALGIIPVAYAFHITAVLRLAMIIGITSFLLFLSGANGIGIEDIAESIFESFLQLPTVLMTSLLLFALGSLHFFRTERHEFGKIFRLVGVKIFLFVLFWLSFYEIATEIIEENYDAITNHEAHFWKNIILAIVTVGLGALYYVKRMETREMIGLASAFALAIAYLFGVHFFAENTTLIALLTLLANIFFIAATGLLLYEGYQKENLKAINFATFAIGAFLFGKYIDLFFGEIDTTLFFFLGGIILITGGVFLEKNRRHLSEKFAQ